LLRVAVLLTPPVSPSTRLFADGAAAFTPDNALGPREVRDFEAVLTRLACSRAYASPRSSPTSSQGSLPACRA